MMEKLFTTEEIKNRVGFNYDLFPEKVEINKSIYDVYHTGTLVVDLAFQNFTMTPGIYVVPGTGSWLLYHDGKDKYIENSYFGNDFKNCNFLYRFEKSKFGELVRIKTNLQYVSPEFKKLEGKIGIIIEKIYISKFIQYYKIMIGGKIFNYINYYCRITNKYLDEI